MASPNVPVKGYRSERLRPRRGVAYTGAMDLTSEAVAEFADIWERVFGERLSPEQARIEATLHLELCWLLVQPLPGEEGGSPDPLITF